MICKSCVLPESKPDIFLNEEGLCNICVDFNKRKADSGGHKLLESDLIGVLNKYRGKSKYDCLIMCSGGKDSVMSLYYMKKRYKLNPLVFTFDHGFENDTAMENIKNAVDILKVDWLFYRTAFMKDIFALIIQNNPQVSICHICAIWYIQLTYETAAKYKIPLIVAGWTKGQCDEGDDAGRVFAAMSKVTADFITNNLHQMSQYKNFPRSINEAIKKAQKKFKCQMISPHWYLQWEQDEIMEVLQNELNWKAPQLSFPKGSTNCLMNFISVDLAMKHYGYTHYHIEMSKLIRLGRLSRQEALNALRLDFDINIINDILAKIKRSA